MRRFWKPGEDQLLRSLFPHHQTSIVAKRLRRSIPSLNDRAHILGLEKSPECKARILRECGAALQHHGAVHRYKKGAVPLNKGLRRPGWSIGRGRMRETQFRKGQEPHNTMPMWSFRWCDGYLMLKTGANTPKPTTGWEYVHKLVWEQAHGSLPNWRVARIWWKDGDHCNCSLSNLELVPGCAHMARTTVHTLPAPLKQVIQLKGALKRRIGRMERQNAEEHDGRSPQPPICNDRSVAG